MREAHEWNARYENNELPWDSGRHDRQLSAVLQEFGIQPRRTLELGCGTGSNAIWLAQQGFTVTGVDIAPLAIERARTKAAGEGLAVEFAVANVLQDDIVGAPFSLIFDRGCFHSFADLADRERLAQRIAEWLVPGGSWVSLIGSADDPPREVGPPQWSAREIVTVVEPHFEILSLRTACFDSDQPHPARNWVCVMRKRLPS